MSRTNRILLGVIVAEIILLGVLGFAAVNVIEANARQEPVTVIVSPASNSTYYEGDTVAIQSTSTDSTGIARVQLGVDGTLVRTDAPPQPQASFTVTQTWKAIAGIHTIDVIAFNRSNQSGNLATIVINVLPAATPTATYTPTATPTETSAPSPTSTETMTPTPVPTPTSTPSPVPSLSCTDNATFVVDVTIPDGTTLAPGQTFSKDWRVLNTGTCAWGAGYTLAFVGGDLMNAPSVVGVPYTAPGTTADLVVPMAAPSTTGTATGYWQLRNPNGAFFGPSLYVTINVPVTPTPIPPVCSGVPIISYFTATSTTINAGDSTTLNWGLVGNADYVEIDNGIGGVATPGSLTVSPATTTIYTMTAYCGFDSQIAQVLITVVPPSTATPTPAPTSTSTPAPTATSTPTPTLTSTPAPTATSTPTPTPTSTSTPTPTATSTPTPTPTSTSTPTPTATVAPP